MTILSVSRTGRALFAATALLALGVGMAEARPSLGGSRGSRTFSAPPPTATAPRQAAPIERSITQPGQSGQPGAFAQRPAQPAPQGGFRPGFGTGFFGGLLGGFLGAGLFGALFGHGLFGGMAGLTSLLGLLLQAALIAGLVMLVIRLIRNRALAGGAATIRPAYAGGTGGPVGPLQRDAVSGGIDGAAPASSAPIGQRTDHIGIGAPDYEAFERNLIAVNEAWDREDLSALRALATPEMVSYFGDDLAKYAGRGLRDRVSQVKLLQGDLSEAWREGGTDYATVAMRFSLVSAVVERTSGRVVEGDAVHPQEVTEIWTFRRERDGPWMLSAIQES